MAYFNRENRGGGKRFNKGGFGGDRGFNKPRPFMHKAICSSCGAECEVPFKPTGDRPVYCNNCFKKPADGQGKFGGGFQQKSFGDKPAFNKPREENRGNDGMKQQLEQLNIKLDKILNALTPAPKVAVAEKKAEEKKAAIGKTKTAAKKAKKKNKK